MRIRPCHLAISLCPLLLAACASAPPGANTPSVAAPMGTMPAAAPPPGSARSGVANLAPTSGSLVSGKLTLMPMAGGVHVIGDIGGLARGSSHGFHIHETGDCSAADGSSAGGHFNPAHSAHGRAAMQPHHAGDIDNILADANGVAHVDARVMGVTLGDGSATDIAHRAFVVHAGADDYTSQPSGNSGARVACGVIAVMR